MIDAFHETGYTLLRGFHILYFACEEGKLFHLFEAHALFLQNELKSQPSHLFADVLPSSNYILKYRGQLYLDAKDLPQQAVEEIEKVVVYMANRNSENGNEAKLCHHWSGKIRYGKVSEAIPDYAKQLFFESHAKVKSHDLNDFFSRTRLVGALEPNTLVERIAFDAPNDGNFCEKEVMLAHQYESVQAPLFVTSLITRIVQVCETIKSDQQRELGVRCGDATTLNFQSKKDIIKHILKNTPLAFNQPITLTFLDSRDQLIFKTSLIRTKEANKPLFCSHESEMGADVDIYFDKVKLEQALDSNGDNRSDWVDKIAKEQLKERGRREDDHRY